MAEVRVFTVRYLDLWGFHPLLKGKQILVDFKYEEDVEQMPLNLLKNYIGSRIEQLVEIWRSGWNVDELKQAINSSLSVVEIANLLK